jgi:nucleoside-diphosphate-sugar epimerase
MSRADGRLIAGLAEAAAAGKPLPIHGDGLQTRSMTFVDDAIRLLLLVADTPATPFGPVNIGSDEERTVLDIARTFARACGIEFAVEHQPSRPGDPQRRRPDITRARALGYSPQTTLEEGLAKTIAWLRDNAKAYA